jgi:hypothetical protein
MPFTPPSSIGYASEALTPHGAIAGANERPDVRQRRLLAEPDEEMHLNKFSIENNRY